MRLLALACLTLALGLPAAAAQTPAVVPEQPRVTLASDGLTLHFAVSDGAPSGDALQVVYSVDGGAPSVVAAQPVGVVVPVLSTDGVGTQVWAATVAVPPGAEVTYHAEDPLRGSSPTYSVRRPDEGSLRAVVMGDIGYDGVAADGSGTPQASAPIAMRELALAQDPDVLLIPGDLSYVNSRAGWDRFHRMQTPLAATVPVVPAIGNHEWEDGVGYGQYLASYVLPGGEEDYVQRLGPLTLVVVNSDAACLDVRHRSNGPLHKPCPNGLDEERLAWLRAALGDAAVDDAPWTAVLMHHPPYSWGQHGSDWVTHIHYAPLFEEFGVDLVLTAHDHLYGRTHQVAQREVLANATPYAQGVAPIYAVLGGGGRELYDLPAGEAPAWLAHGEAVHHLAVLDVDEDRLRYQALRRDGSELDAFTILAPQDEAPVEELVGEDAAAPGLALLALLGAALAVLRRR